MSHKLVSIIVPIYNEQEAMRPIMDAEPYAFELIFVDDGSTDTSLRVLVDALQAGARIKIIELTRNFGKELAMSAGFKAASGDAVIPMDVDLQDPPELVMQFLRKWEKGYDVVLGVRANRASDSAFKRMSAKLFYSFFSRMCGNRLVPNAGDYRLMNRPAVDALNSLTEDVRFTKGLYAWIGYKQVIVEYTRPARIAGTTKWKFWRLWNFALDGITRFSTLPLRIWTYIGGGWPSADFPMRPI